MLGKIDMKEFMAWAERVKAETHVEEIETPGGKLVFAPRHIRRVGKLNAAYAFGCDRQNGGGGS